MAEQKCADEYHLVADLSMFGSNFMPRKHFQYFNVGGTPVQPTNRGPELDVRLRRCSRCTRSWSPSWHRCSRLPVGWVRIPVVAFISGFYKHSDRQFEIGFWRIYQLRDAAVAQRSSKCLATKSPGSGFPLSFYLSAGCPYTDSCQRYMTFFSKNRSLLWTVYAKIRFRPVSG